MTEKKSWNGNRENTKQINRKLIKKTELCIQKARERPRRKEGKEE